MESVKKVKETLAVDLGALLDAGDGAMVTVVAGETRLAAHRAVLVARSPVFQAMFHHDTLEASSGQVAVTDVEGPVMRQLLAYMYTLQAPQLSGMAPQLLAAADKYGLSDLKDVCEQQMAEQLDVENAATAAVLALRHSCPTLRQVAVAFIKAHKYQVVMTQDWADATVSHPLSVVELTRLIVEPPAETRSLPGLQRDRNLIQAGEEGAVEKLEALLAAGADVSAGDEQRLTALHCAAREGHVRAVNCLLEHGAEVDARSNLENTPLHLAAWKGHAAVVRLLLASSADPNATNRFGKTPLHRAALDGHAGAAAVLLESGANRRAIDNTGDTPLDLARQNYQLELIDMLT
ncbi:speckle-type POZ protein-like isoform X2 [Schistocerca nitens]|uniref:speckle-type POZ protein-like isoform X2 n=1 Tax=Schistocerca nitens TaxID=7011 RepID=UPI0021187850|nr:speckle-type POZ protein-like isoform X2 [Schistocerca nitens]